MPHTSASFDELLQGWQQPLRTVPHETALPLLEMAEAALATHAKIVPSPAQWRAYLAHTRHPDFLTSLADAAARRRWAKTTFAIVSQLEFKLGDLLEQRAAAQPRHILFHELNTTGGGKWDYQSIWRRVRSTAALLLRDGPRPQLTSGSDGPRVALLATNSIAAACCDLACLTHDIFVTPLNIHFSLPDLVWIFERLQITVAICDNPDRLQRLLEIRDEISGSFDIYTLYTPRVTAPSHVLDLDQRRANLGVDEIETILAQRRRHTMNEPATVMFTSGSTGRPKGVAFSQANLVTKRFARAAALPVVGRNEVMLCYLPLFHTFGRYLEMLGTIFWGGTYVFAGNPSIDTLLHQFQEIRPTALISVPVRWTQIRERVLSHLQDPDHQQQPGQILRHLVGDRLYWGLSAAGHLDPRVFRFFHRHGVSLCSGFGMTEGTGGLTMTPPDDYIVDSVGVPLPGTEVRFGDQNELQIAGVYIARYLPEKAPPGCLRVDAPGDSNYWLATGDLFRKTHGDHLVIVDRIKDIYKNNRGQTIAPRMIESLFDSIPGITRTFLVGDGRSDNTLLIVPDTTDEVFRALADGDARRHYFEQMITLANRGLATHERVVNFAILDRDFSSEKHELTSKGSYRRKNIAENFSTIIATLYQSRYHTLTVGDYEVLIPRWFCRGLGILDDALRGTKQGVVNREDRSLLPIKAAAEGRVHIGDLEYSLTGQTIDLGILARSPQLWVGNAAVINFCPCRPGWDTALGAFSDHVFLPRQHRRKPPHPPHSNRIDNSILVLDQLCRAALFGDAKTARAAIQKLDHSLEDASPRQGALIRRRLEALANHSLKSVRCRAYQVLVLDQPVADYNRYLPAFIASGKTFMDKESFENIGRAAIEPRRLQALRQRLHTYRTQLTWPADENRCRVFKDMFHLLADFGRFHPEFYGSIREELVSWAIHVNDPVLAAAARQEIIDLATWLENQLEQDNEGLDPAVWAGKVVFQEGLSGTEIKRLREVLIGTTFLKQSIMLAFEGENLSLREIGPGGIFVSRIISRHEDSRYRVSVNTTVGKHFDLQVIISQHPNQELFTDTLSWYIAMRGYPFGTPMLPTFGCSRSELGALSMAYVSDLTVWEKIREFSSVRGPGTQPPSRMRWHHLLVRAMAVVVRGWHNSERRIIPGLITPNNIVVPEPAFRRGAVQNNLTGWKPYTGPLSLIRPLWRNIYQHAVSHYPWVNEYIERDWIFEAFVEALGVEAASLWLNELQQALSPELADELGLGFAEALNRFLTTVNDDYFPPLSLRGAIHQYLEWDVANGEASSQARLEMLDELVRLYRLNKLPEIARFTLYRNTYFTTGDEPLTTAFDRLLHRMFRHPQRRSTQLVELSELQHLLTTEGDRAAFNRLVFPHRRGDDHIELQAVGNPERGQVIVRSTITDRHGASYTVGEPTGPAEVGLLYRLFLQVDFPYNLNPADRYFVATDETEQILGGLVFHKQDADTVFLDGIIVRQTNSGRGIASAILADFCTRMASRHYKFIRTQYYLREFYEKHGFRRDQRLGGLVRFL